jgi:hypothetical protein
LRSTDFRSVYATVHVLPEMRMSLVFPIVPPPSGPRAASQLAADLLRHVCGLNADAPLTFTVFKVTRRT